LERLSLSFQNCSLRQAPLLIKHGGIMDQLGASEAIENVRDQAAALKTLETAFDEFLKHTKSVNVPLVSDVKGVLEDYFAKRPPFSTKKKSEFTDAISIASIRSWCRQHNSTVYIVSDDPDLWECCSRRDHFSMRSRSQK
jgi:hypothetical protein